MYTRQIKFLLMGIMLATAISLSALVLVPAQANITKTTSSNTIHHSTFSGKSASAEWWITDEENSTETFVGIEMSSSMRHQQSDSTRRAGIDVQIYQDKVEEFCEEGEDGEYYCYYMYEPILQFSGWMQLDRSSFRIADSLQSTSLSNVVLTGFDYISGEDMAITVNGNWIATGEATSGTERYYSSYPGEKYSERSTGISRPAEASIEISGDIELDLDSSTDENEARIGKYRNGSLEIIRSDYY